MIQSGRLWPDWQILAQIKKLSTDKHSSLLLCKGRNGENTFITLTP
jgi:hypothetical protein